MKSVLFNLVIILLPNVANSQQGLSCYDAISINSNPNCIQQTYTTATMSMWFRFVANSKYVNISLVTEKFGIDIPHIHNISLFDGSCGSLLLIAEDELPFDPDADKLGIDLNASGLTVGNEYYIRADREAHVGECNKLTCRNNQSTSPSTFNLCIEEIEIVIPLDFSYELPNREHSYEQNRGQLTDLQGNLLSDVKMFTKEAYPQVYIADDKTSFVWSKVDTIVATIDTFQRVDMSLINSNPTKVFKTEILDAYTNYYISHATDGILKNRSFYRSLLKDVYQGIDLQYYSNENGIKFYFVINEGADANDIILKFTGASSTNTTSGGGLSINTLLGDLDFKRAIVYRINPAGNIVPMPVSGDFYQISPDTYGITVQNYSFNMPVIVQVERDFDVIPKAAGDPTWCTYFGGTDRDYGFEIDSDDQGNIYTVGTTKSVAPSFPATPGVEFFSPSGDYDGWLAMFDVDYQQVWTTYIGGDQHDAAIGVDHDDLNNLTYIGMASESSSATLTEKIYNNDALSYADSYGYGSYFARFDQSGWREWATRLPGPAVATFFHFSKVKVDALGNLIVVGSICGIDGFNGNIPDGTGRFPVYAADPNTFQQYYFNGGEPSGAFTDGFIAKFDPNTHLVWGTLFGGQGDEYVYNLATDIDNSVYVVGSTTSSTSCSTNCPTYSCGLFPLCQSGGYYQDVITPDQSLDPDFDGFIIKFNLNGVLQWSTYFGGIGEDAITGIDVDGNSPVIAGITGTGYKGLPDCLTPTNGGFPICSNGQFNPEFGGQYDAFVTKFRPNQLILWSRFLGGQAKETWAPGSWGNLESASGPKVHIDDNQNVLIYGNTKSGSTTAGGWFPTQQDPSYYFQSQHADNSLGAVDRSDNFVAKFNPIGQQLWSTYFGGVSTDSEGDVAGGITTYGNRIYLCGSSNSTNVFPWNCPPASTTIPYCDFNIGGSIDAYFAQIISDGVTNVGIEELNMDSEMDLIIFPNPSDGNFTLSWISTIGEEVRINVYNSLGQVVFSKNMSVTPGFSEQIINIQNQANGLYLISVSSETRTLTSKLSLLN